jgi:hypothetical protein
MTSEVIAATIAAIVAVISAIVTVYGQMRTARLQDDLTRQREERSREAQSQALVARYRDPLLRSAFDLQSRIYNVAAKSILTLYRADPPQTQRYIVENTLYVIAEYLGWVEIMRRDVQFLDLGSVDRSRRLNALLDAITRTFFATHYPVSFRLFRGQQRAIGELMMLPRRQEGQAAQYECMGYAAFSRRLHDDASFAEWFEGLRQDIGRLIDDRDRHVPRLIGLQHALIDLIDFLDPDQVRIPPHDRQKLPAPASAPAQPAAAATDVLKLP